MAEPAKVRSISGGAVPSAAKSSDPKPKTRSQYALPTERINSEKQLTLLRAYAAVSGHSRKPVKLNEVAEVSKISPNTISNANGFFLEAGLLLKNEAGFVPSEEVAQFALAYEWRPETAALKLAPVIRRAWFAERVIPKLSMGKHHENELIDDLMMACAVGPDFRPRIKMLLEFLEVSGVAEREGDHLRKGSSSAASSAPAPAAEKATAPAGGDAKESTPREAKSGVNTAFSQMTAGAVQFNISVKVDMNEFKDWKPERITAFFGGIAAVLSAKAAVEKVASDE